MAEHDPIFDGHREDTTANGNKTAAPAVDELIEQTSGKYGFVIHAAKRARQINAYYSQLGEGLLEYVGPIIEVAPTEKPLSTALREINDQLLTAEDETQTCPKV